MRHTHKHTFNALTKRAQITSLFFNRPFIHFDTYTLSFRPFTLFTTHTPNIFYGRQRLRRRKQQFSAKKSLPAQRAEGKRAQRGREMESIEEFTSSGGHLVPPQDSYCLFSTSVEEPSTSNPERPVLER